MRAALTTVGTRGIAESVVDALEEIDTVPIAEAGESVAAPAGLALTLCFEAVGV